MYSLVFHLSFIYVTHENHFQKFTGTVLHVIAQEGHVDVAKMLIHKGADVKAVSNLQFTALHIAALNGHVDVAKVLIRNGADVSFVHEFERDYENLI